MPKKIENKSENKISKQKSEIYEDDFEDEN